MSRAEAPSDVPISGACARSHEPESFEASSSKISSQGGPGIPVQEHIHVSDNIYIPQIQSEEAPLSFCDGADIISEPPSSEWGGASENDGAMSELASSAWDEGSIQDDCMSFTDSSPEDAGVGQKEEPQSVDLREKEQDENMPDIPAVSTVRKTIVQTTSKASNPSFALFFMPGAHKRQASTTVSGPDTKRIRPVQNKAASGAMPKAPAGSSASAINSRQLREQVKAGTHNPSLVKKENFRNKILSVDSEAEFDWDRWRVRHSECGKYFAMKSAYDTTRFHEHLPKCKGKGPSVNSIESWAKPKLTSARGAPGPTKNKNKGQFDPGKSELRANAAPVDAPLLASSLRPCPGITALVDKQINSYLRRPSADGGGAPSESKIAQRLFGDMVRYRDLDQEQQEQVRTTQKHERIWRKDMEHTTSTGAVYSVLCLKVVDSGANPLLCAECYAIWIHPRFQQALRVPVPAAENYKYTNKAYMHKNLGHIFARCVGLQDIFEDAVWHFISSPCQRKD